MYADVAPGTLRPETRTCIMNLSLLIMLHGIITYTDVLQQTYPTEFMGYFKVRSPIGRKGLISSLKTASYAKKSKQIAV
jgi:hypothetical protein